VAQHEGVPTIRLGREVADEITAGTLTWKQYGGVHPAPFGNAIAARMIDELFNRAWKQPLATKAAPAAHPMPKEPLDTFVYERGRFIEPKEAKVVKGWTLGVPDWKALPGGKRARFESIPMLSATEPGAEMTLEFEGTTVGAFIVAGPDAGAVEASIDGEKPRVVDLYRSYSSSLHYPCSVLFGTDLQPGKHLMRLRVAADSQHGGHAVRIMEFEAN
jgi:hypothetical protein